MLIHSKTQEISYSGMFWALGHFSRFVRTGAKRIDSQGTNEGLQHCAFQNSDGSCVIVISNQGSEQNCQIRIADRTAEVVLAEDSLTTLVCKNAVQNPADAAS